MTEFIKTLQDFIKSGKILVPGASNLLKAGVYTLKISGKRIEEMKNAIAEGIDNEFLFNSRGQKASGDTSKKFMKLPVQLTEKGVGKSFIHGITVTSEVIEGLSKLGEVPECEAVVTVEERKGNDGTTFKVNSFQFRAITDDI